MRPSLRRAAAVLFLLVGVPALARAPMKQLLKELQLAKGDEQIRIIRALGRTGERKAAEALGSLLDVRRDSPQRSAAIVGALGALRAQKAQESLLAAWDYLDSVRLQMDMTVQLQVLRAAVLGALGELGGEGASNILMEALGDQDQNVVEKAIVGLGRLREKKAIEALIEFTRRRGNVAQAAYEALGAIADERCRAPVEQGLRNEDPIDRVPAAYGLTFMDDKTGVNKLVEMLDDPLFGDNARLLASYYLAKLDKKAGLDYLVGALKSDRINVRILAAETLGKSGNKRAVLLLVEAVKGAPTELRLIIARSLGLLGGPRAIYALRKLQDDSNVTVRNAANIALEELGEE